VNSLKALRQVQPGKGFSVRSKALVREHGRAIGVIHEHCIVRFLCSAIPCSGNLM
jgi:hypothetical protein